MIKLNALDAAKPGKNRQNLFLFLWREHVLAMMVAVVRATASTKEPANTSAGLSLVSLWYVIIEVFEAPCFPNEPLLSEILAISVLPGRRIDSWSTVTVFRQQQPGLIVHATRFLCAFIVEAHGISRRNILVCQFLLVHILCGKVSCKNTNFSSKRQEIEEKTIIMLLG